MTTTIAYTGTPNTACPITLTPARELEHAVALAGAPSQPYELASLWKWVIASDRHPLTGETCFLSDIAALQLPWCNADGRRTVERLERMRERVMWLDDDGERANNEDSDTKTG